jgi:hypothetical protein
MAEPPERLTAAEQAAAAGAIPPSAADPINDLREHAQRFMQAMPGDQNGHNLAQARVKLDEMIHWLRAHQTAITRG